MASEKSVSSPFWDAARELTPFVAARHGDSVFIVPTWHRNLAYWVQNKRRKQFVRLDRAVKILRDAGRLPAAGEPAGTLVDAGAHIGTTSIVAVVEHGFSRAVAIEPDPDNVRLLRANAALNGIHDRVHVVAGAIGPPEQQQFFVPGRTVGHWSDGRLSDQPEPGATAIDMVTLDRLAGENVADPATTGLVWCGTGLGPALAGSSHAYFERKVPLAVPLGRDPDDAMAFLAEVAEHYESAVDLREAMGDDLPDWAPTMVPAAGVAQNLSRERRQTFLFF